MTKFIVPFINISPISQAQAQVNININNSSYINYLMGQIKNNINFEDLFTSDAILTNEAFAKFVQESNYNFIPILKLIFIL